MTPAFTLLDLGLFRCGKEGKTRQHKFCPESITANINELTFSPSKKQVFFSVSKSIGIPSGHYGQTYAVFEVSSLEGYERRKAGRNSYFKI